MSDIKTFTIDGREYNVWVTSLKRNFEVSDSDSSGRTADWVMHRDVVGTFYNYSLAIETGNLDYAEYDSLYQAISAPIASHRLSFPYGQDYLTFDAYITKGSDEVKRMTEDGTLWTGLSFNIIAMEPQRRA